MARALGNLGLISLFSEDYAGAIDRISRADEIWRELGSLRGQSVQKQNLAIAHELRGDLERAVPLLEESIELARTDNNGVQVAISALTLGRFLLYRKSSDLRIPALLREGLELSIEVGDRPLTAEGLEIVAHWALSRSQPAAAAHLIGAAEAERERAGATRKPDEGRYFEITVRELVQALGRDGYRREVERGRREPLESAIELALKQTEVAQQAA
jgi:tetratricopeptide (TPR) repeat protein